MTTTPFKPLTKPRGSRHSALLGERFTWGPVVDEFEYPEMGLAVVVYLNDLSTHSLGQQQQYQHQHGQRRYHLMRRQDEDSPWRGGHSFTSLEEALLFGIALKRTGDINYAMHVSRAMYLMIPAPSDDE